MEKEKVEGKILSLNIWKELYTALQRISVDEC